MAHTVLLGGAQLGNGLVELRQFEDRVVSEPARASRPIHNESGPARLTKDGRWIEIPAKERDGTAVARRAPLMRNVSQLQQELLQIVDIACLRSSVARGVDAGGTMQLVDLESGIVGDRRQT